MAFLWPKNTTVSQTFRSVTMVVLAWTATPVFAQPQPWDVDTTVARALARPEVQAMYQERLRAADAVVRQATLAQNPTLQVSHEQIVLPSDTAALEFSLSVEYPFDVSRWRERLRETLPHQQAALTAELDEWRLGVAVEVRSAFFQVRYHEERLRMLEGWITQVTRGVDAMRARESRGDVSRFDVLRIEAEREVIQQQVAHERMLLAQAWAALKSWVPHETIPEIVGPLPPGAAGVAEKGSLPSLRRLESLRLATTEEAEAWGDPFLRGWSLGAGYRLAHADEKTGHGFLVTLSVPLTFTNSDQPTLDLLAAETARLEYDQLRETTKVAKEQGAADERLKAVLSQLDETKTKNTTGQLSQMAEVAYAAGEITVTELLDAFGNEAERGLSRVELEWEARRASIYRDGVYGLGVSQ